MYLNISISRYLKVFSLITVFVMVTAHLVYAGVYINLVAANPSPKTAKEKLVKYYLPRELSPEDVMKDGGLKLDFDLDRSQHYLHGTIKLEPKETKTIKIEVRDVWRIAKEEVDILKNQINDSVSQLEETEYFQTAEILGNAMVRKLDFIMAQQDGYSDNIERRIEEYRAYAKQLDAIRKNAFSLDYFRSEVPEDAEEETVKFIIAVKNSSESKPKTVTHKHYLPREVRAEHIVDGKGFDVRFNEKKQQAYLTKVEEFAPGENKRYTIIIKDIWHISPERIDALEVKAKAFLDEMVGSDYEDSANYIGNIILEMLYNIRASQVERRNVRRYIGAYRTNQDRFKKVQDELIKLERMLARVKAKKLEEFEKSKVKNILQKMKALRGITAISQAIFGKRPTITTTWYVIWGILAFVGFFTTVHFFTWWRKGRTMGEELAIKAGGGGIKEVQSAESPEGEATG